ncbi:hypothetical protein AB0M32_16895 [Streptomyces sp. NPDC051985]|uniref:hypothetical protein n=1 Tax=Streptomyces sp. NPDC051985 TaxID=3155807 RepID=UPI00342D20E7
MPALTPAIRTLTETLADLADYRRESPDPAQALARAVLENPDTLCTPEGDLLITELRTAAWELADQHTLHDVLDDLRALFGRSPTSEQESCLCR